MNESRSEPSIRQHFETALSLHRQGLLDAAERAYTEVLCRDPAHLEAMHHLGVVYARTRRGRQAVPLIARVVAQSPGHADAHLNLANTLAGLMRHKQAIAHYEKALALKPGLSAAASGAAAARQARDDLEALAGKAHAAGGSVATRLWARAEGLREQGLAGEALRYYEASLAAAPGNATVLTNRGNVLRHLGRLDEALTSHDTAAAADDTLANVHSNRGIVLLELGRPEESLAACDRAVGLDGTLAEARFNQGNALKALGRLPEAIAAYSRASTLKSGYADALANKATCHLLQGDFETGLPLYEHRQASGASAGIAATGSLASADRTLRASGCSSTTSSTWAT
jgi:tetratricopeptide (TPR) repeat protein